MPLEPTTTNAVPAHAQVPAPPFEDIYDRYAPLLRYLAGQKFAIPAGEIEPLVQDAFVAYLTDPSVVRDVRSYLVGTICNRCRKYWSRRDREREVFAAASAAEVECDDRALQVITDRLTLHATLSQLSPKCRDVLIRYCLNDEPVGSIAAALETSTQYVHKVIHECRKRAIEAFRALARRP